ncbi:unnamed protein product [Sphagnum tenellum]
MYTIDIWNNTRFFLAIDYIGCGMLNEDNEMYTVDIPNNMCFFLAIDYVGCGMSFQQTTVVICHAKGHLKVPKLGNINYHNVGQYICILATTNLNKIANMLLHSSIWAFSIVEDGNMHRSSSFFKMRICVNGVLSNLHLVAITVSKQHIFENIFNLIARFLDALGDAMMIWCA